MHLIYHAYSEEYGECEGMFDFEGNLIAFWACNDATWRSEYFSGFMEFLGVEIRPAPYWIQEKLDKIAREGL